MAVLYRKYRPQKFSEVIGQEIIIKALQNAVRKGEVAHAYLFTGSRGVGKTTLARVLAKALNCTSVTDGEVCGLCVPCSGIASGSFVDLVEIDAASHTGVDNIRELIGHIKFAPTFGRKKVLIIDEVHMLSKGAFNALLKTLEEPPEHAVFILATTDAIKVPATIISRTARFDFKRLSEASIQKLLNYVLENERTSLEPDVLKLVVSRSEGGMRDALSLLGKVLSVGEVGVDQARWILGVTDYAYSERLFAILRKKDFEGLKLYLDDLQEANIDPQDLCRDFLEYLRKLTVWKLSGLVDTVLTVEQNSKLAEFAQEILMQDLVWYSRLFLRAYKESTSVSVSDVPLLIACLEVMTKAFGGKTNQPQPKKVESEGVFRSDTNTVKQLETVKGSSIEVATVKVPEDLETVISLEEIREVWPEVLNQIRQVNGPLSTLLKNSPLINVVGGVVEVGVKFLFHKENLENVKNYQLITSILATVTGRKLGFKAKFEKHVNNNSHENIVEQALQVFGGELVA